MIVSSGMVGGTMADCQTQTRGGTFRRHGREAGSDRGRLLVKTEPYFSMSKAGAGVVAAAADECYAGVGAQRDSDASRELTLWLFGREGGSYWLVELNAIPDVRGIEG